MKEKIYTIPVNEAYEQDCECPICYLHKKLEQDAVEYALGAAMMEPDYRLISNDKGYCNKHYSMLFKKPNKLSLALVLDTHLEEIRKKIDSIKPDINALQNEKGGLFKKSSSETLKKITTTLQNCESGCVICDKTDTTVERYIEVFFYLWKNDSTFKDKVEKSKGLCLVHFNALIKASFKYLSHSDAYEFSQFIYEKQKRELLRIQEDIHRFTLKFDYRNKDMEWGTAQDAPIRTIEKISGHIITDEPEE